MWSGRERLRDCEFPCSWPTGIRSLIYIGENVGRGGGILCQRDVDGA